VLAQRKVTLKLEFEIDGQLLETEFSFTDGTARLTHDSETYQASISQPEPGLFVVIFNDRVYRCALDKLPSGQTEVTVSNNLRQHRISVSVRDKKRLRGSASAAAGASGRVTITAPMPGKIVRVLISHGDEVAAHQGILIVEAMKMQNEVQAPRAGKVAELRATEGQTVNAGETLVIIE
jgi:biotin carboxyl carrier protein